MLSRRKDSLHYLRAEGRKLPQQHVRARLFDRTRIPANQIDVASGTDDDLKTGMIDFQTAREYFSLVASTTAIASTFWFWLVRNRRERPSLSVHPLGNLQGSAVRSMDDLDTYRQVNPADGHVCLRYCLDLAVVNDSLLPNAVLDISVSLQMVDGTWQQMHVRPADPEQSLFPINLVPMTTAGVQLVISTSYPGVYEGGYRELAEMAGDLLQHQPQIRVQLNGLRQCNFAARWIDNGEGLKRSETSPGIQKAA